jgi:hypothetical protein
MTSMLWMIAASLASWLALLVVTGGAFDRELTAGMAGPLVVAAVTWSLTARTFRATPGRVQALMLHGLAVRLLFFSVYVMVMLRLLGLRPVPFVLSFTGYFVALHVIQAILMRRLFSTATHSAA